MLDWFHLPLRTDMLDDLEVLESSLENAFKPVEPSPEFVHDLRHRLVSFPIPVTPDPDSKLPQYIALTIASLLSGVAIVGFGVWVVLGLIGKYQSDDKNVISTPHSAL
jgi:hypothetical protein